MLTRTSIKTSVGIVKVLSTSTIKLSLLCANSTIYKATFSNVLYAPNMFISIISYSKICKKSLYYYR
jgi:hypothetical protein